MTVRFLTPAKVRRSILTVKKLFQRSADVWHIHGGDLPNDPQLDVGIVVGNDVAHSAHFSKGEFWDGLAACRVYVRRGLTDDFNTPDDSILFLLVGIEIGFRGVFDVCGR